MLFFNLFLILIFSNNKVFAAFDINEYNALIQTLNSNPEFKKDFSDNVNKIIQQDPDYFKFKPFKGRSVVLDCERNLTRGEETSSVHRLRPQDVKVTAAMGDSLSAGLGSNAQTILGLLLEYRGRSWSSGGDSNLENLLTMPNIIKKFNPELTGFNQGIEISLFAKEGKGLNVAVSGDEANNMPAQAKLLIQRLKQSNSINYTNDWKVITIFIGGNDICDYCKDRSLHSPQSYVGFIRQALDILHNEVPRAFVNLVQVLNAGEVKYLNQGLICTIIHQFVCPCAAFPSSEAQENEIKSLIEQYHNLTESLVESGRYDTRDDFTVVVQPFFKNFQVPKQVSGEVDLSYFAPDCFHLSTKGHAIASIGLWNNMLEPVGKKTTSLNLKGTLQCPDKNKPYFFTRKNSNV